MQNMKQREIAVAVGDARELVERAAHAVDVVAEVGVRVEDLRVRGQLAPKLLVVRREQLLGSLEHVVHRLWSLCRAD